MTLSFPRLPAPVALALVSVLAACPLQAADRDAAALPGDSLYQLDARAIDAHGRPLQWSDLAGRPQLVSMFYANCHLMCPLIIENAKAVQKQLPAASGARLGVAMISLDPQRDTPAALARVARDHRVPEGWRFLRPATDDVRALASVLDVRYRFREDGSINHTSVLVLLDAQGRELARSEVEGIAPDPAFVEQVRLAVASSP
ncbi:SCO family protein [Pseudoxanthomonas kaohsiungensis]|uniref:SCO family protein n=1 Tax=Pseudoxanthomonas kaohsiungensis TaxID=283923 RepID=A0ABW3LSL6_9GAMM|nr:SCO family protein [Pseudoxanthomonas kaohsiungensis]KAF1701570.1 SCO family protein [Pseudoxanthomonas kaohsiungensis]